MPSIPMQPITLPASFVVLQGSNGDGMANSLDVLPDILNWDAAGSLLTDVRRSDDDVGRRNSALGNSLTSVQEVDEDEDTSNNDSSSDKENDNSKRNDVNSTHDTEGGLHLPLGSTSPIMRKVHHQTASCLTAARPSPFDFDGGESSSSQFQLSPRTTAQVKQPLPALPADQLKIPAIHQWQLACRERENHAYEEAQQNVRAVLMQRRKHHAAASHSNGSCSRPTHHTYNASNDTTLNQLDHFEEMLELAIKHKNWYQRDGRLIVFESIPHLSLQGVVTHPLLTRDGEEVTLSPGSMIHAVESIVLDSRTLRQLLVDKNEQHLASCKSKHDGNADTSERNAEDRKQQKIECKGATLQLLKITSPHVGYIVSHLHDYPYIAPGSPLDYVPNYQFTDSDINEPIHWVWRVIYQPDGAFVRDGAELISDQIGTLPYGSFCNVEEKIVNEMGLSRLKIRAWVGGSDSFSSSEEEKKEDGEQSQKNQEEWKEIVGWTSLFINPLSGNSGHIVEPVNFPVPVLYRVICERGAVIRNGIELSTSHVGLAPKGTIVTIVGRAFSDSPRSCCIERLRLAGGRGWISARLNPNFEGDRRVVELVGIDDSFDPTNPAEFHFREQKKAMSELNTTMNKNCAKVKYQRQLSEINDNDDSGSDQEQNALQKGNGGVNHSSLVSATTLFQNGMPLVDHAHPNRCLICLSEERTATIVHGETGHIACCLTCARVLKARGDSCPVCREPIDTVIQHFWA